MPELRFEEVGRDFDGRVALSTIDLTIEPGMLTVIIGPSGCGKSTLLELAAGLQSPDRGRVLVDGEPVSDPRPDTVLIFQQHNLFDWFTVRDNVAFGLRNRGVGRRAARERAHAQLASVGLAEFAERTPVELSGGMRQRVALARALVLECKLLLMDEPFANLDQQTRRLMQRYLVSAWRESGATVALVTHDLEEALALADRIVLMSGSPGRILDIVDLELIRPRDPEHPSLRPIRDQLWRHLEAEVAQHEFSGSELAALSTHSKNGTSN
jgi:NitT/TauT family transport system ATP-binding protein